MSGVVCAPPSAVVTEPPFRLTSAQRLLLDCYRSGQIEPWAWKQHLNEDRMLPVHVMRLVKQS